MNVHQVLLAVGASFAISLVGAAPPVVREFADEYIVNVPVRITDVGPGHTASVICSVMLLDKQDRFPGLGDAIGRATVSIPLDRVGNYSGTVAVKVVQGQGLRPEEVARAQNKKADGYKCSLDFDNGQMPHSKQRPTIENLGSF